VGVCLYINDGIFGLAWAGRDGHGYGYGRVRYWLCLYRNPVLGKVLVGYNIIPTVLAQCQLQVYS